MERRSQLLSDFVLLATREIRNEAERAEKGDSVSLFHLARHLAQLTALPEAEGHPVAAVLDRIGPEARSWSAGAIAHDLPGFRRHAALWADSLSSATSQARRSD